MQKNFNNNFFNNGHKLETSQMFITSGMNK